MANELTTETILPPQLATIFKNASEEEKSLLKSCYSGEKKNPSFQEWLESYQQNKLLQHTLTYEDRGQKLNQKIKEAKQALELADDPTNKKALTAELKRLESLLGNNEEHWLYIHTTLAKIVQNTLAREAPRKVEMTHNKVTPGDVAQLLHEARAETVDVEFETIKEEKENEK